MTWPEGIVFPALTDDHVGRLCAQGRLYEADLLHDMRERAPAGLAVDVGAHMGVHTIWLSAVCGHEVWAFEPTPVTAEILRTNVAANGLKELVTVCEAALGREVGRARLVVNPDFPGQNRIELDHSGSASVWPLDHLVWDEEIALVKIDVEGFEMEVLAGMVETLARCRPLVYVESLDPTVLGGYMHSLGYEAFGKFACTPVYGFRWR